MKNSELIIIRDCVFKEVRASLRDTPLTQQSDIYRDVLLAVEHGLLSAIVERSRYLSKIAPALGINRATLRHMMERANIKVKPKKEPKNGPA